MASTFGVVDYLVFVLTLLTSLSVGVYFAILEKRKKGTSPDDYFLAGRKSRLVPVVLSFVVTFQSSVLVLAFPVEVYLYGMIFSLYAIGLAASYALAGLIFVPVIYPLKITSVNKFFYLRYGDNLVRYLAVFTQVVYNIFYMGTVIFGTCVAAEVIMDIPYWVTVLIYTIVTTVYTSIGGIKAVIWTDSFQFLIMISGILAVLIKSTIDAGGSDVVLNYARKRLNTWDLSLDPTIRYTVWNVCFGSFTQTLYLCVSQPGIQRVNLMPSLNAARIMYTIAGPIYAIILSIVSFEGVTVFGYFASKGCDIFEGGVVNNINEMVPFTVSELFKGEPGINGLFFASLSSAALSTISSCLSSLSAITYDNVIRVMYPDIEDTKATYLSKMTVLAYGLMFITFVIAKLLGSIMNIFQGLIGCIDGPTAAIFVVSVFFKKATSKGVFVGAIFGMAISFWLIMGKTLASLPSDSKLPPGPTDQCWKYLHNSSDNVSALTNLTYVTNDPREIQIAYNSSSDMNSDKFNKDSKLQSSGIERFHTVSYMLFSLVAFLVTIFISVLVSFCTQLSNTVDEKYLFSFTKHIQHDLFGMGRKAKEDSKETNTGEEMNDLLTA